VELVVPKVRHQTLHLLMTDPDHQIDRELPSGLVFARLVQPEPAKHAGGHVEREDRTSPLSKTLQREEPRNLWHSE
jgi:hypothetical protein